MSECFRNEKICQQKHRSNWKTIIYALGAAGCSALSLTTSALDEDEALGDAYAILITGGLGEPDALGLPTALLVLGLAVPLF
jgi:hypothetical protein